MDSALRKRKSNKTIDKILIVESDEELRTSLIRLLRRGKFEIFSVQDGLQAKKYLDKFNVGCIIYGLNQPLLESSLQLIKMVEHHQNPCVIIFSSFDFQEVETIIGDMKYSAFVTKPVKLEKLMQLIANLEKRNQ